MLLFFAAVAAQERWNVWNQSTGVIFREDFPEMIF